jgi:hypothetical protein
MYLVPLGAFVLISIGLALGVVDGLSEARKRQKFRDGD